MHIFDKLVLVFASLFNVIGGLIIIILLGISGFNSGLSDSEVIFRLFTGGVAVTLGIGYFLSALGRADARTFLLYGGTIKYWAFFISIYAYLTNRLPITPFLGFPFSDWVLYAMGFGNLVFAILFTISLSGRLSKP